MRKLHAGLAALLLGAAAAALAAPPQKAEPEVQQEAKSRPEHAFSAPRARQSDPVDLEAPTPEERAQIGPARKQGEPPRIGFGRAVSPLGDEAKAAQHLKWEDTDAGGQVASVTVTSPGASALRLGIRVQSVPAAAIFRFHAAGSTETIEVTGEEILEAIAQNLDAGEHGPEARTYWGPPIESESVAMEIELPAGTSPKDVRISIPQVSHLATSARTAFALPEEKAAAACNNDAMCFQSSWGAQMNAVARMVFTSGGSSYLCTGTLLADSDTSTQIPYFLTANHCIGSQSIASSLVTYWFYRSTGCNSGAVGPYQTLTGGATLLYNTTNTDTSFLRLNGTPPAGAVYAGWTAESIVGPGVAITALHHPTGDLLKYSTGTVDDYLYCTPPTNGSFSCGSASASSGGFYDVVWGSGIVQGGSSGSGLFTSNGKYLVGQLYGGSSTCANPTAGDTYGRFDLAFRSALSQWLGAAAASTPPPNYTLTVAVNGIGTGTVTSSPPGISCPGTCSASWPQGTTIALTATPGSASSFSNWSGACGSTSALCNVFLASASSVTASFGYGGVSWPAPGALPLGYIDSGSGWSAITGAAGVDTFEGGTAMKSNPTPDGGSANLTYVANFNAGTVTYARRVSSAPTAFLRVYLDTALVGNWSGEVPWGLASFQVTPGQHTLQFVYDKTTPGAAGADAAWLDAVNMPLNSPITQLVSVTLAGTGLGLVTSSPAGLSCGAVCSYAVTTGMPVVLDAAPLPGTRFDGWGGACGGTALECALTASAPASATATFTQVSGTHKRTVASW